MGDALALLPKRAHRAAIVVEDGRPVGVVTEDDCLGVDRFTQVHEVMTTKLVTLPDDVDPRTAFERLDEARRRLAPVVDADGRLVGVLTRTGALRSTLYTPAVDAAGQAARRGRGRRQRRRRGQGRGAAEAGRRLPRGRHRARPPGPDGRGAEPPYGRSTRRSRSPPATWSPPRACASWSTAGADIVKVGVGPGAMCTTRMMTGVGRPQFSAVLECAEAARELGKHVWADGGVRHPRDVALALAAGASAVMIGSWFAGTYESPGDLHVDADGRAYKESFGMASARAVAEPDEHRDLVRPGPQGAVRGGHLPRAGCTSTRTRPGVEDLIDQICAGVRSAAPTPGPARSPSSTDRAVVGVQSAAGFHEGRPLPSGW